LEKVREKRFRLRFGAGAPVAKYTQVVDCHRKTACPNIWGRAVMGSNRGVRRVIELFGGGLKTWACGLGRRLANLVENKTPNDQAYSF
jgi:hypothetical protein